MTKLEYRNICVSIGGKTILKNASLQAKKGEITGIIGPNGCGKSTLIKTTFGIFPYEQGAIFVDGTPVKDIGRKKLAAILGYVGQDQETVFDFSVSDIVSMGLQFRPDVKRNSRAIVEESLEELQIYHLKDRGIKTLSGGERKLVFLARALAQGTDTIILDEPTNHLDICHQLFIMDYLKKSKKTILIVLHDLRLAAHYCDYLYLMKPKGTTYEGSPLDVLQSQNMKEVFQVEGKAVETKETGIDFLLKMN